MSIKNSNVTIGNRTRDRPVGNALPQPTETLKEYLIYYIINTVCMLHVLATLMAIPSEVHYKG